MEVQNDHCGRTKRFIRYITRYFEDIKTFNRNIPTMPVTMFYKYLWKHNKNLLLKSLIVNYIVPLVLEFFPWWLSRTKLEIVLRKIKINVSYDLQINHVLNTDLLKSFIFLNLLRIFLETLMKYWTDRISLEHKFAIRKLVLQRILHSEIEAFDDLKEKTPHRFRDIGQSLAIFNTAVPAIIFSSYSFVLGAVELWKNRYRLDALAFLHPLLFYLSRRLLVWIRACISTDFKKSVKKRIKKERDLKTIEFISNLIDGLPDIQINNLQPSQLKRLNDIIDDELTQIKGVSKFADRVLKALGKQNVFQFAAENYITHMIIRRKNIEYNQYLTIQMDLDHTLAAVKQIVDVWKVIKEKLEAQQKIQDLVNIPNWLNERHHLQVGEFNNLRIKGLKFSYNYSNFPALQFEENEEIVFERGNTYGIVGQNMAGKSTLTHIICKLYEPQGGFITLNGIPYEHIGRKFLRDMISYTSQTPFLFPGTIRDNILIGNPDATEEEVAEAALLAGVVAFSQHATNIRPKTATDFVRDSEQIGKIIRKQFLETEEKLKNNPWESEVEPDETVVTTPEPTRTRNLHRRKSSLQDLNIDDDYPSPAPATRPRSASLTSISEKEALQQILDSQVTVRGKNMSGGLAQSVALARVYVRPKARIVILDEAVGHMDSFKLKNIILPELFNFIEKHAMTLVVVSHDMELAKKLDYIYVLDRGRVVHQGNHAKLVKQNAFGYMKLKK